MLIKIIDQIPIVNSLVYFPWKSHRIAFRKFAVLWFFSSAPIILSVALSQVPSGEEGVLDKFFLKLVEGFSISELFVYSASFITPLIYLIFDRYNKIEVEDSFSKKLSEAVKVFRGYQFLWLVSAICLLVTAVGFSSVKTGGNGADNTFLHVFLVNSAVYIYVYSLFCWYLSILDGVASGGDFVEGTRDDEAELVSGLSQRLRERGGK